MKYEQVDLSVEAFCVRLAYCAAYCPRYAERKRHSVTCVYHVDWVWTL